MAMLATLLEQHSDRQLPTVAMQATTWWETVVTHVGTGVWSGSAPTCQGMVLLPVDIF